MQRGDIIEENANGDDIEEDESSVRATRVFRVIARSSIDARALLRDDRGIQRGVIYQSRLGEVFDTSLICRGLNVAPVNRHAPPGGLADYRATCTYSAPTDGTGGDEPAIGGPPRFSLETRLESVTVDVDGRGVPITTSSLEPLDPPENDDEPRQQLVVRWWRTVGSVQQALNELRRFADALNERTFAGAPRGSLRCQGVVKEDETEVAMGRVAIRLQSRFDYREPIRVSDLAVDVVRLGGATATGAPSFPSVTGTLEGWTELRADRGTRQVTGVDAAGRVMFEQIQRNGRDVIQPVDLDGSGRELQPGARKRAIAIQKKARYEDFNQLF